jgi:HEPN domain-containing protein
MKDAKREAERWLEQAKRDLAAAETIFAQRLWWIACFQSQQAAEKAVKSFLYGAGQRMVLGHSVAELIREAAAHKPAFADLTASAAALDRFYIPTRYPNGLPGGIPADSYTEHDAQQAIDTAKAVLEFVENG